MTGNTHRLGGWLLHKGGAGASLLWLLFSGVIALAQVPALPGSLQSAKIWPGGTAGSGVEVELAPQDGVFDSDVESIVQGNLDLRDFPAGSYRLPVRVKDAAGVEGNTFFVDVVVFDPKWETSDAAVDSDIDGLPDQWETGYFGNLDATGEQDSDNDGLTNLEELRLGSSPTSSLSPANRVRRAEFYVGIDPGEGKGIPVPAKDGMLESDLEDLELPNYLTESLTPGRHLAGLRVQRETGEWSNVRQIDIVVFEDAVPPSPEDFGIIDAEGFWEDRISAGAGNQLALAAATADRDARDTSAAAQLASTSQTPTPSAKLFVRFKSAQTGFGEPVEVTVQVQEPDPGTDTDPLFVDSFLGVPNDPLFGSLVDGLQHTLRSPDWLGDSDAPIPLLGWIGTGDVSAYGTGNSLTFLLTNGGTLTWLWGNGTYAVTFQDDQGVGSGQGALPRYSMVSSSVPAIVHLNPNTRLRCAGWQATGAAPASGSGNSVTYRLTGDTNIRWLWVTQHRVALLSRHGEVDGWEEWYDQGSATSLIPRPDPGYEFESWAGALTGTGNPGVVTINAPTSITANFRPTQSVKLTVVQIDGSKATTSHVRGETIDLTPTVAKVEQGSTRDVPTGWRVEGSIYDSGQGGRVTVSLTRDTTVYWLATRQYKLEPLVVPSGAGTVQISGRQSTADAGWYDAGPIRLRALPATGNRFVEWYLQKWNEADVQTILSAETPLIARFAKAEPLGDFAAVDGGTLTSPNNTVSHFRSFIPSAKMKVTEVTTTVYSKFLNWALGAGYIETPNFISVRGANPLAEYTQGLKAEWFKGEDWTAEPEFKNVVQSLNVDFGTAGPSTVAYGTPPCQFTETDFFSFRLRGQIYSSRTGKISFRELCDEKVKIVFRGSVVLDNSDPNSNAAVQVDAVQGWNDVEFVFVELTGTARFRIQWDPLGSTAWQDIPAASLRYSAVSSARQQLVSTYGTSNFREGLELVDLDTPDCNIEFVNGAYRPKTGLENHPVVDVTWYGADAYCQWLAEATGQPVTLPDEWLWEYAASGGNSTVSGRFYPWGPRFAGATYNNANYSGTGGIDIYNGTSPVGIFPLYQGLYDMAGNVFEWTTTLYEQGNPVDPFRVLRGGSWNQPVDFLPTSNRLVYKNEYYSDKATGFRPAIVESAAFKVSGYIEVPISPAVTTPNSVRPDYAPPTSRYLLKALEVSNQEYVEFLNAALASNTLAISGDWVVAVGGAQNTKKLLQLASNEGIASISGLFVVKPGKESVPATRVTFHGAKAFCDYLTQTNPGSRYDVPDQWQWENAMLRGTGNLDLARVNFSNSGRGISQSGSLGADVPYALGFWPGFFDAAGNVQEWTASTPAASMKAFRVLRGAAFNLESPFVSFTKADQYAGTEEARPNLGFRPAVVAMAPQIQGLRDKVVLPASGSARKLTFVATSLLASPTWAWSTVSAPAWASVADLGSGRVQITLTPPATAQEATVSLSVADGSGLTSTVSIPVSVQSGGGFRIEELPASVNAPLGQGATVFHVRAVPAGSSAATVTWSLSGAGALASIESVGPLAAKITVQPGATALTNVTVTASGGGQTGAATFAIDPGILPLRLVDFPNEVSFGDNRTKLSIPLQAAGGAVNAAMTWSVSPSASSWARILSSSGRSAILEIDRSGFSANGAFNVTVTDGVTTVSRELKVAEANVAPRLLLPGNSFQFPASARPARLLVTAEDRNAADTLTWSVQPSGAKVSVVPVNNRSAEIVVNAATPFSAAQYTVSVSDGRASASGALTISVVNAAPVIQGPEGPQEFQVGNGSHQLVFSAVDQDRSQDVTLSLSGSGGWYSWRHDGKSTILVTVSAAAAAQGTLTLEASDGITTVSRQVPVAVKMINGMPSLGGLPNGFNLKRYAPAIALPFTINDNDAADIHSVRLAFPVNGVRVELGAGQRSGRLLIDPVQREDAVPIVLELSDGKETVRNTLQLSLGEATPDSHQIVAAEYFFNTEPSPGAGIPIPASNNDPFNDTASYERLAPVFGTLPVGWNRVGLRFKTSAGQWSSTAWRDMYVFDDANRLGTAFTRPDGSVAFSGNNDFVAVGDSNTTIPTWCTSYVDNDPRLQAVTSQNIVFEDADGVEHIESAIVWAEYFIDSDPGHGNGVILPMDRRSLDSTVPHINFDIDTSQLAVGPHQLGIRTRMADGTWGNTRRITFHVFEDASLAIPPKAEVTDAEYVWNGTGSDGFGYGLELDAPTRETEIGILNNQPVQTAPLDTGDHGLYVRFRTGADQWGGLMRYDLTVAAPDGSLDLVNLHVESNIGIPFLNYDSPQLRGSIISLHVPMVYNLDGLFYANFGFVGQGSAPGSGLDNVVTFTMNAASDITWIWGRDCEVLSRTDYGEVSGSGSGEWTWYEDFKTGFGTFPPVENVTLSVPATVGIATGTRQFCTGWTGTGSAPSSGNTASVTFAPIVRTSEVNWQWRKEHQLTIEVNGEGQVFGNFGWIQEGTDANLLAVPNSGHRFVRWENAHTGTSATAAVRMNQPKAVRAVFTKHRVWSVEPVTGLRKLIDVYENGATASVAVPRFHDIAQGSRFVVTGWNVAGGQVASGSGQTASFTVNSDREVRWQGVRQHSVTKRANALGAISVSGTRTANDGDWFDEGVVSIAPVPQAGAVFVEWANDLAGAPVQIQVRLNAPIEADAIFRSPGSDPEMVNVPEGIIRNSPNAGIAGFTEKIPAFAMARTETTVSAYVTELNAALAEKSVRVSGDKVYSRKELPVHFGGLELEWQTQAGVVLRRERVTAIGSQPITRPADLTTAAKTVLRGEVYVSAQSLGGSLVLSGTGSITARLGAQSYSGTMPLLVPLNQMGWAVLQIEFSPTASSLASASLVTSAQQTSNPFTTGEFRFADSDGVEPLAFFFGQIGASANDQLDFTQMIVNTGSYVQNPALSDFAFTECGGDFDLVATVVRPSSGSAGLMVREGIRSDSGALSLAVGSDGKLRINGTITVDLVRDSYTLRLSRRGDSFAAEFFDLDGKWKDAKSGTLSLTLHEIAALGGGKPCLPGTWVSGAAGTFDGLSLIDLSRNEARNNTLLLDMGWPGATVSFGGSSFAAVGNSALPVTCVTIHGAKTYAEWQQERGQNGDYGLPTEWDFEYVAGGFRGLSYLWSPGESAKHANLTGVETLHRQETLAPVATFAELNGLQDLAGNAWEWTDSDQTPGTSFWKTVRGGSYRSPAEVAASSFRLFYGRDSLVSSEVGFRIVRKPFAVAAPAREIAGNNLSLGSTSSGAVRGFNNPQMAFSVSSVEVSNDDFVLYLNEMAQSGKHSVASGWVSLTANSMPLLQISGNAGIAANGQNFSSVAGQGGLPVTAVTWYGANDFARWLSERNSDWSYRLPTEAEWEASALAGYNSPAVEDGNYTVSNSWAQLDRLTGPTLNLWGLSGILASVAEWTSSEAIGFNDLMVVRGGSAHWFSGERSATDRAQFLTRDTATSDLGFRLARAAKTPWQSATADGLFSGLIDTAIISEGGSAKVVMARKGDPVFPMNVAVSCSDPRVQLPTVVSFSGGEASKVFSFTVASDLTAQGQKDAAILLSPDSGAPLSLRFTISDTSAAALSINVLTSKVVAGQSATLRISRNAASSAPLSIVLATLYGQQATTIPGNQAFVDVSVLVPEGVGTTLFVNASANWHTPVSTSISVEQASGFNSWATSHGLSGPNAEPLAAPHGDGVPNLLRYAFNLAPTDRATAMTHGSGTKGMPAVSKLSSSLRVEFVRRKNSQAGLVYKVMHSTGLHSGWSEVTGNSTVTPVDDTWERVVVDIPVDTGTRQAFGRVSVTIQ